MIGSFWKKIRPIWYATNAHYVTGVTMNPRVKELIQQLGEAIHESVSESEQIAGVVKDIREQGFDVLLMLEATIGLNEVDETEELEVDEESDHGAPFTRNDVSFLKSLRITLPEEKDGSSSGEGENASA